MNKVKEITSLLKKEWLLTILALTLSVLLVKRSMKENFDTLSGYTLNANLDSPGNDIRKEIGTAAQLKAKCDLEPTCVGFNSNGIDGYLKKVVTSPLVSSSTYALYTKTNESGYTVFVNSDSPGNDIRKVTGTTSEIKAACDSDPACVGFNSNGTDGYLKNSILATLSPNSNYSLYKKVLGSGSDKPICNGTTACDNCKCANPTDSCVFGTCIKVEQPKKANGSSCSYPTDCTSGFCLNGVCSSGLPNGSSCSSPTDCTSGNCINGKCSETSGLKAVNGSSCNSSIECASGYCGSDSKCATTPTKSANGTTCVANTDCTSNYCDSTKKCATAPVTCAPPKKLVNGVCAYDYLEPDFGSFSPWSLTTGKKSNAEVLGMYTDKSPQVCGEHCLATAGCEAINFDKNSGTCTELKSSTGTLTADTNTVYFAPRTTLDRYKIPIIAGSVGGCLCILSIIVLIVLKMNGTL